MTLKCLITFAEKIAPALTDSVFAGQLKAEIVQLTLLKPMLDIFN